MSHSSMQIAKRLEKLEAHLAEEHPDNRTLADAVSSFRKLDEVAYDLGIFTSDQSYATRVSWWPMISVLGTFSAGKSTFINSYLDVDLQRTGTQAVDDKFTVICYSHNEEVKTLPGVALDADPRFPFYQVSRHIQEISEAGPQRIDAFLQLKTCPSDVVRGKIIIDSPGFDADKQREETLRLTDHIVDLSDLVLIFFDARHPEPGAMRDTLEKLVKTSIGRADSNKFLYILNQVDVTAKEDNPEEVVAAWQRALAQAGLTAGRFYRIYNKSAATPIADEVVRARYEKKRQEDMDEIDIRMKQVEVERAYRIISTLEEISKDIEYVIVPALQGLLKRWKKRTLISDAIVCSMILILAGLGLDLTGNISIVSDLMHSLIALETKGIAVAGILGLGFLYVHFNMRKMACKHILNSLKLQYVNEPDRLEQLSRGFTRSTVAYRSLFLQSPSGWGNMAKRVLSVVRGEAGQHVESLNDRFASPSGQKAEKTDI